MGEEEVIARLPVEVQDRLLPHRVVLEDEIRIDPDGGARDQTDRRAVMHANLKVVPRRFHLRNPLHEGAIGWPRQRPYARLPFITANHRAADVYIGDLRCERRPECVLACLWKYLTRCEDVGCYYCSTCDCAGGGNPNLISCVASCQR